MEDYKELIRSPEFHFLVGSERSRLTIHAGLIQHLSPPLHALISNGQMKESLEREAVLDDIEEETFVAFCEFGYRGSYSTPTIQYGTGQTRSQNVRKRQGVSSNPTPDECKYLDFAEIKLDGSLAFSSPNPDLLSHAKIYVFADRYLISSLKDQALKSLHRDLCEFDVEHQGTDQIIDLIQYCYENTIRKPISEGNSLRSILIEYAYCEIKGMVSNDRLRTLLEDFGEIGADLIPKLV